MHNANENNQQTAQNTRETASEGNLLSSIMAEQTIIMAVFTSLETFDVTKSKFEMSMEAIGNAAQISGQNKICIL